MGSTLGARLRDGGGRVVVALDGRSERTRRLSGEAGLEDVGTLAALLREASFVLWSFRPTRRSTRRPPWRGSRATRGRSSAT